MVIIGAGGHGREAVAIAVSALGADRVLGVLDDGEPDPVALKALGVRHLGGVAWLAEQDEAPDFVAALGYPETRRDVVARAEAAGARAAAPLVHPSAVVGPDVSLSDGVCIWPQAVVTASVRIGRHSHVNTAASISHDGVLGDFVTVGPGARICGSVVLEDDVWVGAGATVIQGVRVGRGCVIGAGAVVLADFAPGTTAVGVPAAPLAMDRETTVRPHTDR